MNANRLEATCPRGTHSGIHPRCHSKKRTPIKTNATTQTMFELAGLFKPLFENSLKPISIHLIPINVHTSL
jgi:hypothetical protein